MLCGMKMLRGVFVLGGVAATDMSTAQAQAQMHPTIAHLQTLFAAPGLWLNALDLIEMCAIFGHTYLPQSHITA